MTQQVTRRSIAKGAAWTLPAVAVASAAPAMAASCTPTTVTSTSAFSWVSTQTAFTSDNGDPEYHTVLYTFTNSGPDALPAGFAFTITLTMGVLEGEEATAEVADTSSNASAVVQNSSTNDDDAGTTTNVATVTVTPTAVIPVNGTFTVSVKATYGAQSGDKAVDESVTVKSPQSTTNEATCVTTVASLSVSGASDGTSYTSN